MTDPHTSIILPAKPQLPTRIRFGRAAVFQRIQRVIDRRWPVALVDGVGALYMVLVGALVSGSGASLIAGVCLGLAYLVVFSGAHIVLSSTSREIHAKARQDAELQVRNDFVALKEQITRQTIQMETFFTAQQVLTWRNAKMTTVITALLNASPDEREKMLLRGLEKIAMLNETLKDLCTSLATLAAKNQNIPLPDAWFRATYMEVQGEGAAELLSYIAWFTPNGHQPRSMSEGKKYSKGEGEGCGVAGLAWKRERPVIVDNFKPEQGWVNNWDNQDKAYKSMICVPVLRAGTSGMTRVVGVITVDTHVDKYFGRADDRDAEERAAAFVQPYANLIALISATTEAMGVFAASPSAKT